MSRYAASTSVAPEKSRAEIERTLSRFGATSFAYGWNGLKAVIGFEARGRRIRFELELPEKGAKQFSRTPTGLPRSAKAAAEAYAQEVRRRWRSLGLSIKSKLVAVEDGISTFEEEFLARIVLPDGSTVGEWVGPQIEQSYSSRAMPPMLPGPS